MNLNFFSLPRRQKPKPTPAPIDLFDFLLEAQLEQHYSSLTRDLQLTGVAQLNRVTDWQLRDCGLTSVESRRLRRQLHRECPQSAISRLRRLLFPMHQQQHQQQLQQSNSQHNSHFQLTQKNHRASATAFGLTSLGVQTGFLSSSTLPRQTETSASKTAASIQRDRIRLGRRLGSGRFGEVRQAALLGCPEEPSAASVPVAVRILRLKRGVAFEEGRQRLERLMVLDHPGLARILGLTEATNEDEDENDHGSCCYQLVMELAPLRSLLECLRDASLLASFHVGALCEFAQQVAQALSYLENRRLPHGSLSARSLLVFAKDRVKVADAGLAAALDCLSASSSSSSSYNAWKAPELLQPTSHDRRDHPADVWSFGVTLWEMFSYGEEPWPELRAEDGRLKDALTSGQRLECPDACPAAHYQLMLHCWRWEPTERPTFAQIASHLPKVIPEKLVAVLNSPAAEGDHASSRQLCFHAADVIIVLDDEDKSQEGVCERGIRVGGNLKTGRFDRRLTRPLLPGEATSSEASCASGGAASASGSAVKMVSRRATLGASYAKEFGQKISRVKKAAQARLQSIGTGTSTPVTSRALASSSAAAEDLQQYRRSQNQPQQDAHPCLHQPQRVRLTSAMISEPLRSEFRHAGHVGADGTVFGDIACLSEFEFRPTSEPPAQSDRGRADNTMVTDGEVRYRSRKHPDVVEGVEVVDALRCQSGYCRLGSSLSLGIETVGGNSSAAVSAVGSYIEGSDYAESWDWRSQDGEARSVMSSTYDDDLGHLEPGAADNDDEDLNSINHLNDIGNSDDNNNNGSSLIDEILRAWCSVAESASETAPALTLGEDSDARKHLDGPSPTGSSSSTTSDQTGPTAPGDVGPGSSETATPSTSVSSLNNGAATTQSLESGEQLLDLPEERMAETVLQQSPEQHPQQLQQLFVSTLVTASSSCSSSLSSVGSVASVAEAASCLCVGCNSPGGGHGFVGSWETNGSRHSGQHSNQHSPRLAAASRHPPQLQADESAQEVRIASSVYSDEEDIVDI